MIDLQAKFDCYLHLMQSQAQDKETGFIEWQACDSLLFSGLVGCIPEVTIGIYSAFDAKSGRWHRRPLSRPCYDCVANKPIGSRSSISRDMLLGLAWYAWHNKRLDISEQIIGYALRNWGFMGCAEDLSMKWGRCQIMPSLFATFCWISYKLGGPSRAWARWIPADIGGRVEGYQAHLQVLHILLRKDLAGKITRTEQASLNYQAARQPRNPLFLHAVGKDLEALEILADERLWPSDRLPRKHDRKASWLLQRDEGKDWESEIGLPDLIPHSGGDFLFCFWLIGKKYELKKS